MHLSKEFLVLAFDDSMVTKNIQHIALSPSSNLPHKFRMEK
jgi:hypothetical protein